MKRSIIIVTSLYNSDPPSREVFELDWIVRNEKLIQLTTATVVQLRPYHCNKNIDCRQIVGVLKTIYILMTEKPCDTFGQVREHFVYMSHLGLSKVSDTISTNMCSRSLTKDVGLLCNKWIICSTMNCQSGRCDFKTF